MRIVITLLFITLALSSCTERSSGPPSERAFYYWKSVFATSATERSAIDSLRVTTLYMKFFDVDLSPNGQPTPIATILFSEPVDSNLRVIPTIFITQRCIDAIHGAEIDSLATRMGFLLSQIIGYAKLTHIPEIQLDCDWTARTSQAFFALIKAFKAQPIVQQKQLSATIRLYQLKFTARVGIPPVDRGMLMCYNMGDLTDPSAENSILDLDVLKQYAPSMKTYPLPLDIALPIFEWAILFRDGKYKALLREVDREAVIRISSERSTTERTIDRDTVISGYSLRAGDVIRFENVTNEALDDAAKLAAGNLVHTPGRIAFFHLDSSAIGTYHVETLDRLYRRLQ